MLNTYKSQRGITFISLVSLLILLGFLFSIAIKLVPVYLEHFKVDAALERMTSDARAQAATDDEIREMIIKKLQIDDVDHLRAENIEIKPTANGRKVSIAYESRVHIIANIEALVTYKGKDAEIRE